MIKRQEFCHLYKVFHFEHSSNDKVSARSPPKICAFLQSMPLGPLEISKCTEMQYWRPHGEKPILQQDGKEFNNEAKRVV